jgi:putative transposase
MTQRPLTTICRTLRIGRAADVTVTTQIRTVIRQRAAYGYRRVTALVNREFGTTYHRKRIRRVMDICGWTLPRSGRRRTGRAHTGQIRREGSNERWCSDTLELACWNGEMVMIGFALDCCAREALAHIAAPRHLKSPDIQELLQRAVARRFGGTRPPQPIQWLSDNDGIFTALDTLCTAERLNLIPITVPAYSPQSNGMAEAFVNTLRRDYIASADLASAQVVLEQIPEWFADYNAAAPHSALGFRSPLQYRGERSQGDLAESVS